MGHAVDEAREERELTRKQLADTIDQLETRVRAELDWRARLRRDGARYAVLGVAGVATVAALLFVRAKMRHGDKEEPGLQVTSLNDIADELQSLRDELAKVRKSKESQPLWQKAALRAVTTAGATAGTMVARSFMEKFTSGNDGDAEPSRDV